MTIPGGYLAFCRSAGLEPYHPTAWATEQVETFLRWKAQHVTLRQQMRVADGTWALMNDRQRETARRDDETMATAPPPSRVYRTCECHRRPRQAAEDRRAVPTSAAEALAFITSFAPTRRGGG